jgi:hypothetical protein
MRSPTPFGLLLLCLLIQVGHLYGQKARPLSALRKQAIRDLDPQHEAYKKMARQIWDYAEPGFKEVKSSGLLQKTLADNGFTVQVGVAGMPTAFVSRIIYQNQYTVVQNCQRVGHVLTYFQSGIRRVASVGVRIAGRVSGEDCPFFTTKPCGDCTIFSYFQNNISPVFSPQTHQPS